MEPQDEQSIKQKIVALCQSEHVPAMLNMLKRVSTANKLVGDSEFSTIVNAVKFDTQQDMIVQVLNLIESVKDGTFISKQD